MQTIRGLALLLSCTLGVLLLTQSMGCEWITTCRSPADCPSDKRVCSLGRCTQCVLDSDCPYDNMSCVQETCINKQTEPSVNKEPLPKTEDASENTKEPTIPEVTQTECTDDKCKSSCSGDDECPDGQTCTNGSCEAGCKDTKDCPEGAVCRRNQCVPNCIDDSECLAGFLCIRSNCTRAECRELRDCSDGKVCLQNKCVFCQQDTDCPNTLKCINKACLGNTCEKQEDCKDGLICKENQCKACTDDKECTTSGTLCLNGSCKAGNCRTQTDCTGGLICSGNQCKPCTTDASCGAGKICASGKCVAVECKAHTDCKDDKICKNNKCTPCASNQECGTYGICTSGACVKTPCKDNADCHRAWCNNGQCAYCTKSSQCGAGYTCLNEKCYLDVALYQGAYRWSNGTYAANCTRYRYPKAGYRAIGTDGLYWIQPTTAAPPFQVRCDMRSEGGGWTLVMKVNGTKKTFEYDGDLWTNTKTYQPTELGLDTDEAKFAAYNTVPFRSLKVEFKPLTGTTPSKSQIVYHTATSLYDVIKTGQTTPFQINAGRARWKALIPNSSMQFYCHQEGFNVMGTKNPSTQARARIGLINNEQLVCDTPDSVIGVGTSYNIKSAQQNPSSTTAGNITGPWEADNGATDIPMMAYVWIREFGRDYTVAKSSGAYKHTNGKVAQSCMDYIDPTFHKTPPPSDLYWIQPASVSAPFQTYCDMKTEGGGWTLVMKTDGTKKTFSYDAAQWTSKTPLNPTSPGYDATEAKLQSYTSLPFGQMMLQLKTTQTRSLVVPILAPTSLYDLISPGTFVPFSGLRPHADWEALLGNGSLQKACTRQGLNTTNPNPPNPESARVRIGVIADNSNDGGRLCLRNSESRIGIGGAGTRCRMDDLSVGNATYTQVTSACTGARNGPVSIKAFGYVFVR